MKEKLGRKSFKRECVPRVDALEKVTGRARYTADLANNLGNLLHRVTSMTARYCRGAAPPTGGGLPHR